MLDLRGPLSALARVCWFAFLDSASFCFYPTFAAFELLSQQLVGQLGHRYIPMFRLVVEGRHQIARNTRRVLLCSGHGILQLMLEFR